MAWLVIAIQIFSPSKVSHVTKERGGGVVGGRFKISMFVGYVI